MTCETAKRLALAGAVEDIKRSLGSVLPQNQRAVAGERMAELLHDCDRCRVTIKPTRSPI